MDERSCPRCKTTKYRNPSLKLMVNVCGHSLCDNCVELLFIKGSAACPECSVPLRRGNFRVQLFEDPQVEKEVDIRKRILRDYNKREEDFDSLKDYNDYLEEIEHIVYNLANNIDVEETKARVEQYKKDNKVQIQKNRSKLGRDGELIEELLELEKFEAELHKQQRQSTDQEEERAKILHKEALIEELMFSDAPAGRILALHSENAPKSIQPASVENAIHYKSKSDKNMFLPVPKPVIVDNNYKYEKPVMFLCGPDTAKFEDLETLGYLSNVRPCTEADLAGGFRNDVPCFRAMQEAMCGLFFFADEMEVGG